MISLVLLGLAMSISAFSILALTIASLTATLSLVIGVPLVAFWTLLHGVMPAITLSFVGIMIVTAYLVLAYLTFGLAFVVYLVNKKA